MHHFDLKNGALHAEGAPLDLIADEVGTPVYVYSTATLKRHYGLLRAAADAHRDALDLKLERTGIDRYFDVLLSSHDYGHAKEAQAFWRQLNHSHPFDPARALLVDDSLPVLHSGRLFGLGHLASIRQPDSSLPAREHTDPFPAIDDFLRVLP